MCEVQQTRTWPIFLNICKCYKNTKCIQNVSVGTVDRSGISSAGATLGLGIRSFSSEKSIVTETKLICGIFTP